MTSGEARELLQGHVLLMEDQDVVRDVVTSLLQRLGLRVTAVVDGAAAIAALEAALRAGDGFDLALLDLTVPGGMGGAETLPRLRALDPALPAVASSGDSSQAGPGFQATLNKPYTIDDVRAALGPLLRR